MRRQAELAHAVRHTEDDRLRPPPQLGRDLGAGHPEDLAGRDGVDVVIAPKGIQQPWIVGDVRQHPQVDLRVIRSQQHPAGRGDDGPADLPPFFGPDGDVLQVRIRRDDPTGGRHRLVERGVHAARPGVHQSRQHVDVGRLQLGELTVSNDVGHDLVVGGQVLQDLGVGGVAGLGLFDRRQLQLLKQDESQLFGRADVELAARQPVDLRGQLCQPAVHLLRKRAQVRDIHGHAGFLHRRQHGHERHFDLGEQLQHLLVPHAIDEDRSQPAQHIGGLTGLRHLVPV